MPRRNLQEVEIRTAHASDADAISAMIRSLAADMGKAARVHSEPADFLRLGFCDPPCFQALIAETAGQAVGLCLYFFSFSSWLGKRGVYVQDLYVDRSQRGTGLGRRLMAETARRAWEQGAVYLRLSVDQANVAAQEFYSHVGLSHSGHEYIFSAVGESFDALRRMDEP